MQAEQRGLQAPETVPVVKIALMDAERSVQAAAAQWKVAPASLRTENGEVIDDANNRRLGYGVLAPAAANPSATPQMRPAKRPGAAGVSQAGRSKIGRAHV